MQTPGGGKCVGYASVEPLAPVDGVDVRAVAAKEDPAPLRNEG